MTAHFEIDIEDGNVRLTKRDSEGHATDIYEQAHPGRFVLTQLVHEFMGGKYEIRKVRK
jgi:hypothetical protein